jgi:hypothetical protein
MHYYGHMTGNTRSTQKMRHCRRRFTMTSKTCRDKRGRKKISFRRSQIWKCGESQGRQSHLQPWTSGCLFWIYRLIWHQKVQRKGIICKKMYIIWWLYDLWRDSSGGMWTPQPISNEFYILKWISVSPSSYSWNLRSFNKELSNILAIALARFPN